MRPPRVGVACVCQETNTFSPLISSLADFESQGLRRGTAVAEAFAGTNTEVGGALAELAAQGCEPVPIMWAWAMSSGPIRRTDLAALGELLTAELCTAGHLDGLVLALHGAFVAEDGSSADLFLATVAREVLGHAPIVTSFDLHANVTTDFLGVVDGLVGYLTYPHIDQGDTGRRAARLVTGVLSNRINPVTRHAKRPLLIAAEAQGLDGPLGALRQRGDELVASRRCLDVSLFPVQPWLDVAELGFAVTVTTDGDPDFASYAAEELAAAAWSARELFAVSLVSPTAAIDAARRAARRPTVFSESADSPTAGTAADSPAMVAALAAHGQDMRACVAVTDPEAVARCHELGIGGEFDATVGCFVERRFHIPARLRGAVRRLGGGSFQLTGPAFTGMEVSMGRFAVVVSGLLEVLLTERPAPTFDPVAWRTADIRPESLDIVVVRSANLFRAAYAPFGGQCLVLDLPGASTPRLDSLSFVRAPRPLYPLDQNHAGWERNPGAGAGR